MTGITALLRPEPPWIYGLSSDDPPIAEIDRLAADKLAFVARLDCTAMTTVAGLYDEFAGKLRFPNYFGHNWAALDECLTDLEWLGGPAYILLFENSPSLFADEGGSRVRQDFVALLESVAQEWAQPVELGEWWDRPPVPFHAVFLGSPDLGHRLPALG